jgi:hypothetical protein
MSQIDVVPDGKKFKILVNFIQRGISYSSADLANQEAERIHSDEMPNGSLRLAKTKEPVEV